MVGMTSNNRLSLDERYPGFRNKELVNCEGIKANILSGKHVEETSPCYNFGYYIGMSFQTR